MQPESLTQSGPETPATPTAGDVYVDGRILGGAGVERDPARLAPEAHPALEHLRDAGYRVTLVGTAPRVVHDGTRVPAARADEADPPQPVVDAIPAGAEGWLVTGDAAVCTGVRELRRLRTILIGPTVQGRGLAHRPADAEARDLLGAVLVILAAGAMLGDARAR